MTDTTERFTVGDTTIEYDSRSDSWVEVGATRKTISPKRAIRLLAVAGLVVPGMAAAASSYGFAS